MPLLRPRRSLGRWRVTQTEGQCRARASGGDLCSRSPWSHPTGSRLRARTTAKAANRKVQRDTVMGVRRSHSGSQRGGSRRRSGCGASSPTSPRSTPDCSRSGHVIRCADPRCVVDRRRSVDVPTPTETRGLADAVRRTHGPCTQVANRRSTSALQPKEGGECRRAHPLVSTYTIAMNTGRSPGGATPPFCAALRTSSTRDRHSPTMHPAPAAVTIHRPQPSPCRTTTPLMRNTQLAL